MHTDLCELVQKKKRRKVPDTVKGQLSMGNYQNLTLTDIWWRLVVPLFMHYFSNRRPLWFHGGVVLLLGSVPAYYREVHEAICCRRDERVQVEVFQRLLQRTELSKTVLDQVRRSHFTPDLAAGYRFLKGFDVIVIWGTFFFKKLSNWG